MSDSKIENLSQLADPASQNPADDSYAASVELRTLAQEVGDRLLFAKAWAWGSVHLSDLARHNTVMSLHPVVQSAIGAAPHSAELDALNSNYLYSYVLVAADVGEFPEALRAQREFSQLNSSSENLFFRVHERILLALLTERMGDAAHANWLAEDACSDYLSQTGKELPPSVYNALMAMKIGQYCRGAGLLSRSESHRLLREADEDGQRALAGAIDLGDERGIAYIKGNLAELFVYTKQHDLAFEYLEESGQYLKRKSYHNISDWLQVTLAKVYNASGDPKKALSVVRPLYRRYDYDGLLNGTRARRVAAQACQKMGDFRQAYEHMKRLEMAERRRTMSQLQVQSEMFMTRLEVESRAEHHRRAAEIDPLTKLGNRRRLHRAFSELLDENQSPSQSFAIAIIDIDHFKRVNDSFGHSVGDSVLIEIASILEEQTRSSDVVIRLGGEEFLILFPNSEQSSAAKASEHLRETIAEHAFDELPKEWNVTVSVGLAATPPHDSVRLMTIADEAMYRAKRKGRNCLVIGQPAAVDLPSQA